MNNMTERQKRKRFKTLMGRIEDMKNRQTFFRKSFAGNNICDKCPHRMAWQDKCKKFNCNIKRINQRNGGFHHIPCEKCLNYKITELDVLHLQNVAKMVCR